MQSSDKYVPNVCCCEHVAILRWHFSNHDPTWVDPDNSAFVKCTVSPEDQRSTDETKNSGGNLYLFMELVSGVVSYYMSNYL